jgi:hypothetical protein
MRLGPVALLWLALTAPGRAADPGALTPAPASPTEQDRLVRAVQEYQSGRWDAAQIALTTIISDPSTSLGVQQEARIYLGEVLFTRGEQDAARQLFEQVLTIDPDFQVDPFRHPPEILTQFEIARSSVVPFQPPEPFRTKFVSTLIPGGLYQLQHERPVMGTTLLVTQVGLVAANVTMWISLLPLDERTYDVGSPEEQSAKLRRGIQLVAGYGALGSYLLGFVDASHQWRVERKRGVALDVPIGVTVSGRL